MKTQTNCHHQQKGIDWIGDDDKANTPEGAAIIDLNGKALMQNSIFLHFRT